jgi:dTDP-4-dehydrorhamnose reductase
VSIAIIGADGQLGSDIVHIFSKNQEVIPLTIQDMHVEDFEQVRSVLTQIKPDAILNTAAYHKVSDCETQQDLAWQVNCRGALNVAKVAEELHAINVYYSTDYVFDGLKNSPYVETDAPNPQSVYATTKLMGEYFTRNYSTKHFLVRVSGIYGKVPSLIKGENFITAILKQVEAGKKEIRVVDDEILTPTPTLEIARNTLSLIQTEAYGVYHMTSEGECSWYEFTEVIFKTLKIKTPLARCSVQDFPSVVKRPAYSVLENANLKRLGLNQMTHWNKGLIQFLKSNYDYVGRQQ